MNPTTRRHRVLLLSRGDAARGPMAEGWARQLLAASVVVESAGIDPVATTDPRAVKVMAEVGVDVIGHRPRGLAGIDVAAFDCVVTLCRTAAAACPVLPASVQRIDALVDDAARAAGSCADAAALVHYRRVRNELRSLIESLPEALAGHGVQAVE